jgi:hypothetical protein
VSLRFELKEALGDLTGVDLFTLNETVWHGETAVEVMVVLDDGRTITGTFTTESKAAFGGVEFSQRKDVPRLMRAKVESVLAGKAEL